MALDFSSLLWILFIVMALQPLLMGRWYTVRRAQAIRAIERAHGTRVITMIHRQEKRSLFGFSVARHIDLGMPEPSSLQSRKRPPTFPSIWCRIRRAASSWRQCRSRAPWRRTRPR
jgi:Serine dehydrogenase proteinase